MHVRIVNTTRVTLPEEEEIAYLSSHFNPKCSEQLDIISMEYAEATSLKKVTRLMA